MKQRTLNDAIKMFPLLLIVLVTLIVVILVSHHHSTYNTPTQYILSSFYPQYVIYHCHPTTNTAISTNCYLYELYGLNQPNGTSCLIEAKEIIYTYNYTKHAYIFYKQIFVTNRNALINIVNGLTNETILSNNNETIFVEPYYTLVCPQIDFQNQVMT